MEKYEKIYPPVFSLLAGRESFTQSAKNLLSGFLPTAGKTLLFGFAVFCFLFLQFLLVGVSDRFGISPKTAVIASSLFYAFIFAGFALIGGLRNPKKTFSLEKQNNFQPVCKILFIRRRKLEIKI